MEKSLLVLILRSCTKKEFRELRKWLSSPMHNQRPDVIHLFDYLLEDNHLYQNDFLKKEIIFRWVFGKEQFDDAKLRQTMFFTTKNVEEYLIYQELRHNEVTAQIALATVYRKKKLRKPFQKNLKVTNKLQEKQEFRNHQYLRNEYFLQNELYFFQSAIKRIDLNLQEVSDALDATYIADKIRQSCLMLAHQAVYKKKAYDIGMLNEVLEFAKLKNFLEYPAIAMYYYSYMAITDQDNESHFQNLKNEIAEHGYMFPKSEMRDILLLATNYCIGRLNAGYPQYIRESFELFGWGIRENALLDEGILSRITFMNIVTIGNMLGEYDWIEKFIHNYKGYLEDQYRDDLVHYSFARLHFEKGDYSTAMQLFRQVEYDDILMNLNAKLMQFKMFYEQDDLDVVESLLESMRTYLVRKKVIGYHKANYKNIIRLTKKMLKINPYNQTQKTKLLKEIEEANPLAERKWLLKQLEKL